MEQSWPLSASSFPVTNYVSGKIIDKKTGSGIPDLLVVLFDLDAWADPEIPKLTAASGGAAAADPVAALEKGRRPPKKKAGPRGGAESGGTEGKGLGGRGTRGNARGVAGRGAGGATGEYEFVRDGISYRVATSPEGAARFDAIPAGDTVVYTIHDHAGAAP